MQENAQSKLVEPPLGQKKPSEISKLFSSKSSNLTHHEYPLLLSTLVCIHDQNLS